MKKEENNNMNIIGIIIFLFLIIKVGQYVYKNEQETRRNTYYNTPTIEQVEKLKKLHERLKKEGVIE